MQNYTLLENKRRNKNLVHENFIFNKETRKDRGNAWRCSDRKCPSVGTINNDGAFVLSLPHNHTSMEIKIAKTRAIQSIVRETVNTGASNLKIITTVTSKLNEAIISEFPKYKSINDKCTRLKNSLFKNYNPEIDDI